MKSETFSKTPTRSRPERARRGQQSADRARRGQQSGRQVEMRRHTVGQMGADGSCPLMRGIKSWIESYTYKPEEDWVKDREEALKECEELAEALKCFEL